MLVADHSDGLVTVSVYGEFTLSDFQEFEAFLAARQGFQTPLSLLIDLRQMAEATLDVMWEEIQFSREHVHDFQRIAVVTDSQWVAWSAWVSQAFMDAELQVFEELADAEVWLAEGAGE